jgi:hypothetical protein
MYVHDIHNIFLLKKKSVIKACFLNFITFETSLVSKSRRFTKGWPACRAGGLPPSSTPSDTPCRTPMKERLCPRRSLGQCCLLFTVSWYHEIVGCESRDQHMWGSDEKEGGGELR